MNNAEVSGIALCFGWRQFPPCKAAVRSGPEPCKVAAVLKPALRRNSLGGSLCWSPPIPPKLLPSEQPELCRPAPAPCPAILSTATPCRRPHPGRPDCPGRAHQRRAGMAPVLGHLKSDGHLGRNLLAGAPATPSPSSVPPPTITSASSAPGRCGSLRSASAFSQSAHPALKASRHSSSHADTTFLTAERIGSVCADHAQQPRAKLAAVDRRSAKDHIAEVTTRGSA